MSLTEWECVRTRRRFESGPPGAARRHDDSPWPSGGAARSAGNAAPRNSPTVYILT
jgi:hypothetical protein